MSAGAVSLVHRLLRWRLSPMAKELERDLGLPSVVAISIGAMVGGGIFILPALAMKRAGPGPASARTVGPLTPEASRIVAGSGFGGTVFNGCR